MKIKFTRAIFVSGQPFEVGDVHDFPTAVALEILSERDAVRVEETAEKAEAKHPAKETAARK